MLITGSIPVITSKSIQISPVAIHIEAGLVELAIARSPNRVILNNIVEKKTK